MLRLLSFEQKLEDQSNWIGVFASGLCLIHCLATPLIFVTKMCTDTCCAEAPGYWLAIDYLFLVISFIAVFHSVKASTNKIVKRALWISWLALALVVVSEILPVITFPDYVKYIPGLALIILHLCNRQFCECEETKCCTAK